MPRSTTTTFVHGKWTYCSPVLLLSAYKKWPPAKNYREVHSAQAHNNIFSFITSYINYISSYIGSHKILSKMQKIWIQDGIQPTNFADCFFLEIFLISLEALHPTHPRAAKDAAGYFWRLALEMVAAPPPPNIGPEEVRWVCWTWNFVDWFGYIIN